MFKVVEELVDQRVRREVGELKSWLVCAQAAHSKDSYLILIWPVVCKGVFSLQLSQLIGGS